MSGAETSGGRTRPFELTHEDITLSGYLAEPESAPRALILALHGHGMSARYFTGPADPALSLLELGAARGYTVWAPDRVGYGASADAGSDRFAMFAQAAFLCGAVDRFTARHPIGAGCLLVGHSFGLKLALAMAAAPPSATLLGVDGSGSGLRYAFEPGVRPPKAEPGDVNPSWGPADLYPPATFDAGVCPTAPVAAPPRSEVVEWPDDYLGFAGRIAVPVRFTFGDHDRLWEVDEAHFDALRASLSAAPFVDVVVQHGAGHNVSLARTGRSYHLGILAFAEKCIEWRTEIEERRDQRLRPDARQ